ncbi:MAG: YjgN family protein [Granulosicoccus sp.]
MQSAKPEGSQTNETPDVPENTKNKTLLTKPVGPKDTPPTPGNETRFPVSFTGSGKEYFRIWIVNIMLSVLTLFIYSAWAKVRNERYFAGNTFVDDSSFDYHATGKQILLGRVVAVALLAVAVILGSLSPIAEVAIVLATVLAMPWVIWRSLKFNFRMKSYRNVRFEFSGSLTGAYLTLLVWPLLPLMIGAIVAGAAFYFLGSSQIAAISMGLALLATILMIPLVQQKVSHYALNGSQFGQSTFTGTPSATRYYSIYLKALGLSLLIPFAIVSMLAVVFGLMGMQSPDGLTGLLAGAENMDTSLVIVPVILMYVFFILGGMLVKSYVSVRIRHHLLSQTQLDGKVSFQSTMRVLPLMWLVLSNSLLLLVTLGLAMPWTKVRLARYEAEHTCLHSANGLHAVVAAEQSHQSSLGDEIGEAFDMDVSIGI